MPFPAARYTDTRITGASPRAYSCSAHVRPCAQGRCGRCPLGFGVMSEFFYIQLLNTTYCCTPAAPLAHVTFASNVSFPLHVGHPAVSHFARSAVSDGMKLNCCTVLQFALMETHQSLATRLGCWEDSAEHSTPKPTYIYLYLLQRHLSCSRGSC